MILLGIHVNFELVGMIREVLDPIDSYMDTTRCVLLHLLDLLNSPLLRSQFPGCISFLMYSEREGEREFISDSFISTFVFGPPEPLLELLF
jgi:hypothetical protein